jgi:recombination protein RecR
MTLLKWPEKQTRDLGQNIHDLRNKLHICDRCGALSDTDPCSICINVNRSTDTLCIVPEWDAMLALEEGGFYKGQYFIIGGLIAPLENVTPEQLELDKLKSRLLEGSITEIIFALGTTIEAENTVSYIKELVKREFPHISVSRLAQGIPLGSDVKFVDKATLRQSLNYRQKL